MSTNIFINNGDLGRYLEGGRWQPAGSIPFSDGEPIGVFDFSPFR